MTEQVTESNVAELVRTIAASIADAPEEVSVEIEHDGDTTELLLDVAQPDIGRVIGKQGRTVRSIRTILQAVSAKAGHRYTLEILEEDE